MHLTLFLQQSEGRDHTGGPFLPEGAAYKPRPRVSTRGAHDPGLLPRLSGRPRGCTAAPALGSLGSAAKVNNECIFLLGIVRLTTMLVLCQLRLFSVLVSTNAGRDV